MRGCNYCKDANDVKDPRGQQGSERVVHLDRRENVYDS